MPDSSEEKVPAGRAREWAREVGQRLARDAEARPAPKTESVIFRNFIDLRGQEDAEVSAVVTELMSQLPKGERVVLVMSKSEFGRVSIPLNLVAAEPIS